MRLSETADILTIIAFIITIWQLLVMNSRLKRVESEIKRKYKTTIDLLKIRDILNLIHTIQDDLTVTHSHKLSAEQIRTVIIRMQFLNDSLIDTRDDELTKKYGRSDHDKLVSSVSSNINLLREAAREDSCSIDTRFICENLQCLRDSIKLIETHLSI